MHKSLILFGPVHFALGWLPKPDPTEPLPLNSQDDEDTELMEEEDEDTELMPRLETKAAVDPQPKSTAMKQVAASCTNPMMIATLGALILSLIEPARAAFVDSSLYQTMRVAGDATTPLMLANLGAGMALHMKAQAAGDSNAAQLDRKLVFAVVLGRLVLCPLATVLVLATSYGHEQSPSHNDFRGCFRQIACALKMINFH